MPNEVGPLQPMSSLSQEDFRGMVDHLLSYNPDCPPQLAKRRINARLREVQDRRMWGGLLVRGMLNIPAVYNTGTVAVTNDSTTVTGTATAWSTNDKVNTTLSVAITLVDELQDVTPVSMTGIEVGDWLTIDAGLAGQEFLLVVSITATTFRCRPALTHLAAVAITKSSLVRRQFRIGTQTAFYGIKGVISATSLVLDMPWAHATSTTAMSYEIVQAYVHRGANLRMVWSLVNHVNGWGIRLYMPQDVLQANRSSGGSPLMLNDFVPDEIGRFQYQLTPVPTQQMGMPYLAYRTVPNLDEDEDTPPPCIPSHMLVAGGISDVLMFDKSSRFYDQNTATAFAARFELNLAAASMADDSIYQQAIQWAYGQYPHNGGWAERQDFDDGPNWW